MRITAISIYVPEPSLALAGEFYATLLGTRPRRLQNGVHRYLLIASTTLTIEVHPATTCPHTTLQIEFTGDAEAAAERFSDRIQAALERTSGGDGWWTTDPGGNTVVLIDIDNHSKRAAAPRIADKIKRGDLVRISPNGKVYRVIRHRRDGHVYLSAGADHPDAAARLPEANRAYDPSSLTRVSTSEEQER